MLRRLRDRLEFTRGLGFRLGTLLSVAILPLGLISLIQNLNLAREAERSAEIALMGRTASAAAGERALLQSALGSADALGPAGHDGELSFGPGHARCRSSVMPMASPASAMASLMIFTVTRCTRSSPCITRAMI